MTIFKSLNFFTQIMTVLSENLKESKVWVNDVKF